jgi:hypothetical protein
MAPTLFDSLFIALPFLNLLCVTHSRHVDPFTALQDEVKSFDATFARFPRAAREEVGYGVPKRDRNADDQE